ncbi:hypothetical protein AB0X53_05980 [Ligilactobacillus salivarius]|uniref:hypothetical protein n=1 Tax=Ligilactobacillus salivarius TaxID=1624 RepID=UPI003F26EF0D
MKIIEVSKIRNFGWNFTDEYIKKIYILYLYAISGRNPQIATYKNLQNDLEEYIKSTPIPPRYQSTVNAKTLRQLSVLEDYGIINLNTFANNEGWNNVYNHFFTNLGVAFSHYCKIRIDLVSHINSNKINDRQQNKIMNELDQILADFIVIFLSNLVSSDDYKNYFKLYTILLETIDLYGTLEEDMFYLIATEINNSVAHDQILEEVKLLKNKKLELRKNGIPNNAWNYSTSDLIRGKILVQIKDRDKGKLLIASKNKNYSKFKKVLGNEQ